MTWIKDILLDVVVLILVAIYSIYQVQALVIILWIYSALLLLVKILALFMPALGKRAANTSAPDYIFHLIYLLVILAFFYTSDLYLAIIWVIIWAISTYQSFSKKK